MRSVTAVGLFAALSLFAGVANAETLRHQYFGVMVNGFDPDPARGFNVDEGFGLDVWYGTELDPQWYLEGHIFTNTFETGLNGGSDYYQSGVSADLMATLFRRGNFTPYAVAGIGFVYDDAVPNTLDSGNFYGSFGGGLLSRALGSSNLRIRIEGRVAYDSYEDISGESGVWDYRGGVGLEIPIAQAELVVREVPVPAPPVAPDGYPPRPVATEVDSDNDGVLDNFDLCPNTLPGAVVDSSGCVGDEQAIAILYSVHFEWSETRLLPDARTILDIAARAFEGQPNLRATVVGHADSTGSGAANQRISLKRAQAVRDFLVSRGIDAGRISARGAGEVEPVAPNNTEMGRWENRRVEFRLNTEPGASPK